MLSSTFCCHVGKRLWTGVRMFTINSRCQSSTTTVEHGLHETKHDLYDEIEVVDPIISEYVESQENSADRREFIRTLLQCSNEQARYCLKTYKYLKSCPRDIIKARLDYLEYYGFHSDKIVAQPLLLSLNEECLPKRIDKINSLKYIESFDNFYPLVCVPLPTLNQFLRLAEVEHMKFSYPSRLHYLASKLEVSVATICIKLSRFKFLIGISYDKIDRMTMAMLENGMSKKYILKDLWVYRHNEHIFHERLTLLRQGGIRNIKGWMMRTPEPTFQRFLSRHLPEVQNQGELVESLTTKFGFEPEMVADWLAYNTHVKRVDILQLKSIVDYLKQVGYTSEEILSTPDVISSTPFQVQTRVEEFTCMGCQPPHLSVICCDIGTYFSLITQVKRTPEKSIR